jgi:hypothetical protein
MRKLFIIFIIAIGVYSLPNVSWAANFYVDKMLASNCISGNYSISNRNCTGTAGNAYTTVQAAVTAMSAGDHIILRGGTYQECVIISTTKNGTAWTVGNYNKLSSCNTGDGCATNEWAILDGNGSCTTVIGKHDATYNGSSDLKYWHLERIEIKNGTGYGFEGNGGPFKIRYCYIHDNKGPEGSNQCDNLPAGTFGYQWHDSLIEYNWYKDNGGNTSTNRNNCKQLGWISSYNTTSDVASNGFPSSAYPDDVIDKSNEIRYNYIEGGNVGIALKHYTIFTGRNPSGGHDYDDTYKDYGTKVHHNILYNLNSYGIGAHGDFWQIYNNIIDSALQGIRMQYDDVAYPFMYKVAVYNNTIIAPTTYMGVTGFGRVLTGLSAYHWVYIYNNICDGCGSYDLYSGIQPAYRISSQTEIDTSNEYVTNNLFYRPVNNNIYKLDTSLYTNAAFESQTATHTPRESYQNAYDAGDLLYVGTSGADKYLTRGAHVVEGSTTIATGGIGGNHPYLSGVTIPSYVGATNPNDPKNNAWVNGVLGLSNVAVLRESKGIPSWSLSIPRLE